MGKQQHEWAIMARIVKTVAGMGRVFSAPLALGARASFGKQPKAERVGVQFENGRLLWFDRYEVEQVA